MAEVIECPSEGEPESQDARPKIVWSGSLRMGLVDIPVRAVTMTMDRKVRLRTLHKACGTPISHRRYCEHGDEVPFEDVAYGYRVDRDRYVAFSREEIEAARPESSEIIDLDSFVTLRYSDEVADPGLYPEVQNLPLPSDKELYLAREIVDRLTGPLDLAQYQDSYRQRIEAMVQAELQKRPVSMQRRPRRAVPESLHQALEETVSALR